MSTPTPSSAGVALYSMQISRAALKRWAEKMPREVGGALITEALTELVRGDCAALKSLPFVSRLNARRRKKQTAGVPTCASTLHPMDAAG